MGRDSKKTEPHETANQQVRFEGESRGERKTVSADVHVDALRTSRSGRDTRHANTTPTSCGQDQKLREEYPL